MTFTIVFKGLLHIFITGARHFGQPFAEANAAMVLLHGRGATPEDILTLGEELHHEEFAYLAPRAAGYTWYPYSFLAPIPKMSQVLALASGQSKSW